MNRQRTLGVWFLLIFRFFFPTEFCFAEPEGVALATFVKGEVWLIRGDQKTPLVTENGIQAGDIIETGPSGKARLVFLVDPVKGLKMLSPSSRFEVSGFLQARKDPSLVTVAPEILHALSQTTDGESVANISRGPGKMRLLFPLGEMVGNVDEAFWLPVDGATSYQVLLSCPAKGTKKEFTTMRNELQEPLAPFEPGASYMLSLTAWRENQQIFSQKGLFYFPRNSQKSLDEGLHQAEQRLAETEDPTVHLVKGILLLKHRLFGNALQQFLRFGRRAKKTGLLAPHLRAALTGLKFSPEDADAVSWESLFTK